MSLIIDKEVYEWLNKLDLLKVSQVQQQLPSGKVVLEESVTNLFLTGTFMGKLLTTVIETYPKYMDKSLANHPGLSAMKIAATPSSKLNNWNVVCDTLKKMNIEVDQEVKSLIIAGDVDMIHEIIKELHTNIASKDSKDNHLKTERSKKGNDSASPGLLKKSTTLSTSTAQLNSPSRFFREKETKDVIDLNKINIDKELSQTENLLEFFLASVAKSMNFTPRQTVQVLSNNHKYLAHIVAKGIKEVFEPIIKWFKCLINNVEHMVFLISKEEDKAHTMIFVHHAMKAGLVSKDFEVAQNACKFFQKLAYEYFSQDLLSHAWEWFVSEQGGLQYCLLCIKRHPEIAETAITVIIEFSRYNLMELFTHHLKRFHPETKEYLITIRALLKPLSESPLTKEEIISAGIIDVWLDFALNVLESEAQSTSDVKLTSLGFLCDIWAAYPQKIEDQEEKANKIIVALKKITRDPSKCICIAGLTLLFRLLSLFSENKNAFAPIIYKTLTFCFMENYSILQLREFILYNFRMVFTNVESIPISVVLEPLIKQLQVTQNPNTAVNLPDIEFLESIARHQKLGLKYAIQLLDVFAKVYLNNIAFAPIAGRSLLHIFSANMSSEPIQEYIVKFVKISLAIFFSSEKGKRPKEKILPRYNNKHVNSKAVVSNQELEQEVLNAQRRALIIEIIKSILSLECKWVNNKSKTLILFTHRQLKEITKLENKGILALISLYGQVNDVIAHFEDEMDKYEGSPTLDTPGIGSMVVNDQDGTNFFKELGIVKKKKKLDKAQVTEMAMQRKQKADPKIMNKLLEIKQGYSERVQREQDKEEIEREKQELAKKKVQQELEKRKMELGVGWGGGRAGTTDRIIFDEGSKESAKLKDKPKTIQIINLENEEDRDQEGISITLRKYAKVLKHLFMTYVNSTVGGKSYATFAAQEQKANNISVAELWKLLKEHDMNHLTTQEEVQVLLKLINTQVLKKVDVRNLDFEGFQQFLIQLSIHIYSKPPKDISDQPIFRSLQEFIKHLRDATAAKGKSTLLFDDPDATEMGDKDLTRFLNDTLLQDPNYPLPEAYKKVYEKDLDFRYCLPQSGTIQMKYQIAYDIVGEIVSQAIGVQLAEPMTTFTSIAKAKLKLLSNPSGPRLKQSEPFIHRSLDEIITQKERTDTEPQGRSPVLRLDHKYNISLVLKKEIVKFPAKDMSLATEVAEVLEDILRGVERRAGPKKNEPSSAGIPNRIVEERMRARNIEAIEQENREKKRVERSKLLRNKLGDFQQQKEEDEARKRQQMMEKAMLGGNKDSEYLKQAQAKREKVREYREKKDQEEEAKRSEQRRLDYREQNQKKEKFADWNAQKLEEIKENHERIKQRRDEEERNRYKQAEQQKEHQIQHKRKRAEELKVEKRTFERKKQNDEKIKAMLEKKEMRELFKYHEKPLKQIYASYASSVHIPIGVKYKLDELVYKGWMNFAAEFSIHPTLITLKEVQAVFYALTNHKVLEDGKPATLSFAEFEEAIVRTAIKAGDVCNELYSHKVKTQGEKGDQGYGKIMNKHKKKRDDDDENEDEDEEEDEEEDDDESEKIDEATMHTIEGLFFYLDLPKDRQAVFDKLNTLRSTVVPFNEKKRNLKKILESKDHNTKEESEQQGSDEDAD